MKSSEDRAAGPRAARGRRDGPDARARARVAELEAEVAALRATLLRAGIAAERAGRAADAAGTRPAAAETDARHGLEVAAGRADLAASEAGNAALRSASAALAESRAALHEREERLRLVLDSAADYAIFTTDLDRRVTSWNAGAERVLGWAEDEIVGRPADVIFTPEDRASGRPEREAATALAEGRAENERWHLRKDGTRFWASGLAMPLRDPQAGPGARPLGLLTVMRDRTEHRRAEERRALLVNELNHRVKNTLVVVQSLAALGTRGGTSPDLSRFAAAFQRRILALARAHDLLTREDWTGAPLGDVVRAGLAPVAADGARVDLSALEAPGVFLPPGAALTLAMAVHELAANALRHGALSVPQGRVRVACLPGDGGEDGTPRGALEWLERGGPPVPGPPAHRGFGLRLLERGLAMQAGMGADLRFEPEGLRCTISLPSPRQRLAPSGP
jgi:PAS domain S-box-containing protein